MTGETYGWKQATSDTLFKCVKNRDVVTDVDDPLSKMSGIRLVTLSILSNISTPIPQCPSAISRTPTAANYASRSRFSRDSAR